MAFKTVLKTLAGIFGSLLIAFGILTIVLFFLGNNLLKNIDKIDDTIRGVSSGFIEENRAELQKHYKEGLKEMDLPTKEGLMVACNNPEIVSPDYSQVLNEEFCSGLESMPEAEMNTRFLESVADVQMANMVEGLSSGQVIGDTEGFINSFKGYFARSSLVMGLFAYLFGVFLLIASSSFNLIRGFYKVTLKTSIDLIIISVFLFCINIISGEKLIGLFNFLKNSGGVEIPELPAIILKLAVIIIVKWFALSTNPILIWTSILIIPFIAASIFLYIKKKELAAEVAVIKDIKKLSKKTTSDNKDKKA